MMCHPDVLPRITLKLQFEMYDSSQTVYTTHNTDSLKPPASYQQPTAITANLPIVNRANFLNEQKNN
jgi:hypothetical protein